MAFDRLEYVRIEGEFLTLAGGDLWDRVEACAWEWSRREADRCADKQKAVRATERGRRDHCQRERVRRMRNKTIVRKIRCCRVCRKMYCVTAAQVADGNGRFCTPSCAAKWTRKHSNSGRPVRLVTIDGKTRPLPEWAKRIGISLSAVYKRIRSGLSPESALTAAAKRGMVPHV